MARFFKGGPGKLPAGYSGGFTVNRNKLLPLRKVLSLIKVEFLGI